MTTYSYSRPSPFVYAGTNAKLLLSGGIEFKDNTQIFAYAGSPVGLLPLPVGSIVLDNVNAKLWQATDAIGGYQAFSTGGGGGAVEFNSLQFSGAGTGIDPITLTGLYYPAADSATAVAVRKANGVTPVWTINTIDTTATLNAKIQLGTVDAFSRTAIWNYGTNSSLRLGSLAEDGDPTNISSEGIVVIGTNSAGNFSQTEWAYARIKSTRIGILNTIADVQAYIFRADEVGMYVRNDAGTKTLDIARATGNITTDSGILKPRVDSTTGLKFTKADGTTTVLAIDTSTPQTTTAYPIVVSGLSLKPAIEKKVDQFKADIVYPSGITYATTAVTVTNEAQLIAAIAAASTGTFIQVTADITLTATLLINKSVKIDGDAARILQTAAAGTDPVTMISVTANDVYFGSNLTLKHRKTTNTSVECCVAVNATGFVSYAAVQFMETGYTLRGSWSIYGSSAYTGAIANSHRHFIIYALSAPSQFNGVVFDFPQEVTARSNFILLTSSVGTDKMNSVLRVKKCTQLSMVKYCRQFFMQDAYVTDHAGVTNALIFESNIWNDLNGGIGSYTSYLSPMSFYEYIAVIDNWQGDAASANYKGIVYYDGYSALGPIGQTKIFYGGNRHPTTLTSSYTSGYDIAGVCYNNTIYTNLVPISSTIQGPDGSIYDAVFRSLYDYDYETTKAALKTYFDTIYEPLGGTVEYGNKPLTGSQLLTPTESQTIITYTVPALKKFRLLRGSGDGDGNIVFNLRVDGVTYVLKRCSYQMRDVDLTFPIELVAGQILDVIVTNDTMESENNTGSVYLLGKEFTA